MWTLPNRRQTVVCNPCSKLFTWLEMGPRTLHCSPWTPYCLSNSTNKLRAGLEPNTTVFLALYVITKDLESIHELWTSLAKLAKHVLLHGSMQIKLPSIPRIWDLQLSWSFLPSSKLIVALSSEQKDRIPTGLVSKFHVSETFIQCQGILNFLYWDFQYEPRMNKVR